MSQKDSLTVTSVTMRQGSIGYLNTVLPGSPIFQTRMKPVLDARYRNTGCGWNLFQPI